MKDKTKTKDKMRRNIRMYYLYRVFCTMNFVAPIFMLFLIDKGLSSFEIFMTQAAYTLTEVLLTVPAGAFADKVGRKKMLIISSAVYAVAYAVYGLSSTFVEVLIAELVFAFSSATFQGTGEAFVYDTLAEARQEKRYKKVVGTAYAIQSVTIGTCGVVGGLIARTDLALPFFISAVPAALSMVPLFLLEEPVRKKYSSKSMWKLMKGAAVYVARHSRLRNVMYFTSLMTVAGFMGWLLYQPMLTNMGIPVEWLGVVVLSLMLANALGSRLAQRFEDKLGHLDLMGVFAGVKALLYLLVYLAGGPYLIAWALLADLLSGIASPIISDWVNTHSKPENRATVLSLSSMSGCLAVSAVSPFVGLYVDAYSEKAAYLLIAIALGAYALRQIVIAIVGRNAKKR